MHSLPVTSEQFTWEGDKIFSCVKMMLNLTCFMSKTLERGLKAAKVRNDCNDWFPSVCHQSRCRHHPPQRARGRLRLGQKHPQNRWSPGPESSRRSAGESPSSRSWFCCRQFVWSVLNQSMSSLLQKVQICYLCNYLSQYLINISLIILLITNLKHYF